MNGMHAENGGEFHLQQINIYLDFFSSEYGLIIEWNENNHYLGNRLNSKHLKRQRKIKRILSGCIFVNIKQSTFNEKKAFKRIDKAIIKQAKKLEEYLDKVS